MAKNKSTACFQLKSDDIRSCLTRNILVALEAIFRDNDQVLSWEEKIAIYPK